jgi:hypothetical protein
VALCRQLLLAKTVQDLELLRQDDVLLEPCRRKFHTLDDLHIHHNKKQGKKKK